MTEETKDLLSLVLKLLWGALWIGLLMGMLSACRSAPVAAPVSPSSIPTPLPTNVFLSGLSYRLALDEWGKGKLEKAIKLLDISLEHDPKNTWAINALSNCRADLTERESLKKRQAP